eukprot:CAMPEP_0183292760 /NCGR_PEP_ID=MMETSP0160_2-20130417/1705_1 /TAXON_ID=2839 ORGANISM="Odontella Sinensis, Strain Grunow 1884" /NCGR_SAMPLE_ID=MMETSP0160_2 /ASSEMBLY_ACC=CAM_ASM_000250 /LENGTH=134 /DNA_ID=CAMNT_0025453765 /DNA_START=104 /DNA_END=505 /DNA_ORIENTATION=-
MAPRSGATVRSDGRANKSVIFVEKTTAIYPAAATNDTWHTSEELDGFRRKAREDAARYRKELRKSSAKASVATGSDNMPRRRSPRLFSPVAEGNEEENESCTLGLLRCFSAARAARKRAVVRAVLAIQDRIREG